MTSPFTFLPYVSHIPFAIRQTAVASSSRQVLAPRNILPLQRLPSIHDSYRSCRGLHTATQPSADVSTFPGIPTQVYVEGPGVPLSAKGKEKEVVPSVAEVPKRKSMIKAKKNAITMTPSAIAHLHKLLASPTNPQLVRIGVKSRGCAGMAYHLDYVSPPGGKFDEVVEQDGVRVLIDSKALFSIIGSRMDWRDNRLSAGFVFDNPNVVDTCGCGESFNIRV